MGAFLSAPRNRFMAMFAHPRMTWLIGMPQAQGRTSDVACKASAEQDDGVAS